MAENIQRLKVLSGIFETLDENDVEEDYNAHGDECTDCDGDGCQTCDFTGYAELPSWDARAELDEVDEDIARIRHLSGMTEAPLELDAKNNKGNDRAQARDAARAKAKRDTEGGLTPKEKRDADRRAGDKLASNPDTAIFGEPMGSHIKGGKDTKGGTIANFFPADVDINDPAVKRENFIKAMQKAPAILFGEINARLKGSDANSLAVSDRLSDIVRDLDAGAGMKDLSPEDKEFAMKVAANAMNNMELARKGQNDGGIDVPDDDIDVDNEFDDEFDNADDEEYVDAYDDEDGEFEEGAVDDEECDKCHGCGIMASGQGLECTKCNGTGYTDGRHREDSADEYYGDEVTEAEEVDETEEETYEESFNLMKQMAGIT